MMTQVLEAQDLTIGFRRRTKSDIVLARELNLELKCGVLVGLLGPNGVGKSTLLRTLAGMQKPLAGRVLLTGNDLATLTPAARARQLSMVLTAAPQPGLMNGYSLVALGRHPHSDWLGKLSAEDHRAVVWALNAVDADDLAEQPLAQLSDGQRQKLTIARALAQDAAIMLLDEPTAYLDFPRRVETMRLLNKLARSARRAILVSTHDLDLALRSCDQLWLMSASGIVAGAPEDLVLAGRLGATFASTGVGFDMGSGAFVIEQSRGRRVAVIGDGHNAFWMRRALERAGYESRGESNGVEVAYRANGSAGHWQLRLNGRASAHPTIQAVLEKLESEAP